MLTLEDEIRIGKLVVASSMVCIKAIDEPKVGNVGMDIAPFGGMIFRKI